MRCSEKTSPRALPFTGSASENFDWISRMNWREWPVCRRFTKVAVTANAADYPEHSCQVTPRASNDGHRRPVRRNAVTTF